MRQWEIQEAGVRLALGEDRAMEILDTPPSGPVVNVRKSVIVLLLNGLFMSTLDRLAHDFGFEVNRFWYVLVRVYFVGHALLAIAVAAKGQLPIRFPIDRSFMDVLLVIGAPWMGPILWYREREKVNQRTQK